MTPLLAGALITHILAGVAAIGLLHLVLLQLLRRTPAWGWAIGLATWSVLLLFVSWASSAYYYVVYYGAAVKPVIQAGEYPWAHAIFMEGKEHVFIMIPFLALTLLVALQVLKKTPNSKIKKPTVVLAALLVILGLFVALSGVLVSGAAG